MKTDPQRSPDPRHRAAADHRVGVVGAGRIGSGIAEVCALANTDVLICEPSKASIKAGRKRITASLDRGVATGKVTERERAGALGRLHFTTDLADFADRSIVLEAVSEDAALKCTVFERLDAVVRADDAVLASTTSSVAIAELAKSVRRPGRVLGLHFFHPVPVMPLVELVVTQATTLETRTRATAFAEHTLGKDVVATEDRSGFVVNALLVPYLLSAIRMVESGFADRHDVDRAIVSGLAHPLGPLALTDLVGLDTVLAIAEAMTTEYEQPLYEPPKLLRRMVSEGHLGRKSGQGFYRYDDEGRRAG